jgi:Protein of unknown function (DUF2274)
MAVMANDQIERSRRRSASRMAASAAPKDARVHGGQKVDPAKLVVPMLAHFMSTDRVSAPDWNRKALLIGVASSELARSDSISPNPTTILP